MKYRILLALALLCGFLFRAPAIAQEHDQDQGHDGPSIVGTWISELTDPTTGKVSLFEIGSYSPDGSFTSANVNGLHTAHKGIWQRIGHWKFNLTVMFFTHDAQGTFNGIIRARILVTVAEDGKSYDSVAERTVMDTAGNVLSVTPGIVGHSVRMELLPPPG